MVMAGSIKIERHKPPDGPTEMPFLTSKGYKMADPSLGGDRHHIEHAKYEATLNDVIARLLQGWSLWMKQPGKRETLISASSLNFPRL